MVKQFCCSFEILFGKLHADRRDPAWLQSTPSWTLSPSTTSWFSLVGDLHWMLIVGSSLSSSPHTDFTGEARTQIITSLTDLSNWSLLENEAQAWMEGVKNRRACHHSQPVGWPSKRFRTLNWFNGVMHLSSAQMHYFAYAALFGSPSGRFKLRLQTSPNLPICKPHTTQRRDALRNRFDMALNWTLVRSAWATCAQSRCSQLDLELSFFISFLVT